MTNRSNLPAGNPQFSIPQIKRKHKQKIVHEMHNTMTTVYNSATNRSNSQTGNPQFSIP